MDILRILQARGVTMMTNTRVAEITSSGLIVTDASGNQQTLAAENVVLATGALANRQLAESLRGKVPELHLIGDAKEPRFIKEAIAEGFQVGRSL
jgi:NADH dehydrogenase FAD-containing subunit